VDETNWKAWLAVIILLLLGMIAGIVGTAQWLA
jgi:F0F1-type ATP synthase assembly protein I